MLYPTNEPSDTDKIGQSPYCVFMQVAYRIISVRTPQSFRQVALK